MVALKQELEQMRVTDLEKSPLVKEEDTPQIKGIQLALVELEDKENKLKYQIEEAKSWSRVVSGSTNYKKIK